MNQLLHKYILKERVQVVFCILILTAIGIKWSIGLCQHLDILFGDEAEYIRNGVGLFHTIRNDWGPSYNMWYKILSLIFKDNIQLYYANYILGGIAVSVFLFIALYAYDIDKVPALCLSFCFFVSSININTWPRISHFVLILVLLALILISRLQTNAQKSIVFASMSYICAYARPELFFAFIITSAISLYFMYKERAHYKRFIWLVGVLILLILFFQITFGFPSSTYKGGLNRLYSAFCQHYAINYKYRTHTRFDAITEWIEFCKARFPGCSTITDVIKKHPAEFLQHLLFNLKNYSLLLLLTICSFVFPTGILHSKKALMVAAAILTGLLLVVFTKKEKREFFMQSLKRHSLVFLFLFIFGLPSIGMSTIIFPRPHYMLLHSVLLLFLLAFLVQALFHNISFKYWQLLGIGLLLIPVSPRSSDYSYLQFGKDMDNLCEQKLIRFLETKKEKPYMVFTNYLNITYILPENYAEFSTEFELRKGMQFASVLKEKKINVILVSGNILKNPILVKDAMWNDLIANPEKYSFKEVHYSDRCESYLLIKE